MDAQNEKYNFRVYVSMDTEDLQNAIEESIFKTFTDQDEAKQFANKMIEYGFSVVIWEYLAEE